MTRLIDNMERQHLVVRISDKKTAAPILSTSPKMEKNWKNAHG